MYAICRKSLRCSVTETEPGLLLTKHSDTANFPQGTSSRSLSILTHTPYPTRVKNYFLKFLYPYRDIISPPKSNQLFLFTHPTPPNMSSKFITVFLSYPDNRQKNTNSEKHNFLGGDDKFLHLHLVTEEWIRT